MDVAITGASGLIGSALVPELRAAGHTVRRLVRRTPTQPDEVGWDPARATIDVAGLAGIDGAVHLAGEGIAARRWTDAQKRRILESRTAGTRLLAETMAALDPRPGVLLSASGVDYYGSGGEAVLTEESPRGTGFLSDVVVAWEAAARPALDAGIRTVFLRSGAVLSPRGGAMGRVLPLFKLGLGGPIGDGSAWWPWVALEDEVQAIIHLLTADVAGPVNLTAPGAVRNRDYTKALGRALHRPTVLRIPLTGPRLLLGRELTQALLVDSKRVEPARLLASGYTFRRPEIDGALRSMLS